MLGKLFRARLFVLFSLTGLVFLTADFSSAQPSFWEQTQGPEGGQVEDFVVHTNGDVFALCYPQELVRSVDQGEHWTRVPIRTLTGFRVHALAIAENAWLYVAGSVQRDYRDTTRDYSHDGLYRSTDLGSTWTFLGQTPQAAFVRRIVVENPNRIFIMCMWEHSGLGSLVYRSDDGGSTYLPVDSGMHHEDEPIDFVRAASGDYLLGVINLNFLFSPARLYRSVDDGQAWQVVSYQGDDTLAPGQMAAGHNAYVYVSTRYHGVLRATEPDDSWVPCNQGLPQANIYALAVGPNDEVYAGIKDWGLYVSHDFGSNWFPLPGALPAYYFTGIAVTANGNLLAGMYPLGAYRSTDNGLSWTPANSGIIGTSILNMKVLADGAVLACGYPGIWRSSDGGMTWNYRSPVAYLDKLLLADGNTAFASKNESGILRSLDGGQNWQALDVNSRRVSAMGRTPQGTLVAGTDTLVYRSTDLGLTWSPPYGSPNGYVSSMLVTHDGSVLVCESWSSVYRSTDDGLSWRNAWQDTLFYAASNSLHLVDSDGAIYASLQNGLHRSTDDGVTWTPLDLNWEYLQSLALSASLDGTLYGSFGYDLIRSTDHGQNWEFIDSLTYGEQISSLAVHPDGHLLAATYGTGVFRSRNPLAVAPIGQVPLPTTLELSQNYPNPFNNTTQIRFGLPQSGQVSLSIFNIIGQKVEMLADGFVIAGYHTVSWKAQNASSGVYFYRIEFGGQALTQKMVLLK